MAGHRRQHVGLVEVGEPERALRTVAALAAAHGVGQPAGEARGRAIQRSSSWTPVAAAPARVGEHARQRRRRRRIARRQARQALGERRGLRADRSSPARAAPPSASVVGPGRAEQRACRTPRSGPRAAGAGGSGRRGHEAEPGAEPDGQRQPRVGCPVAARRWPTAGVAPTRGVIRLTSSPIASSRTPALPGQTPEVDAPPTRRARA